MAEGAPQPRRRLTRKRLLGLDRSGPEPTQTRAGAPLRPFTWPNLIGYIRLAAIPVFLIVAFNTDDGRSQRPVSTAAWGRCSIRRSTG
jgi:hypothetical protein